MAALTEATVTGITAAMESHALGLGLFDQVNLHEPESPPGHGLSLAIWLQHLGIAPRVSGLSSGAGLLVFGQRIYSSMSYPLDMLDPHVAGATSALFGAYAGDFTLGGYVMVVDLKGISKFEFKGEAGYLDTGDVHHRVMTLQVPLLVDDVWTEAP